MATIQTVTLLILGCTLSHAFQWTSTSTLPDGITVPACPGQDVELPWGYNTAPAEHLTNIEWRYKGPTGGEVLLATVVFGNFLPAPSINQHMEFVPAAGIRLKNVGTADAGTYTVYVNINLHGQSISEKQTVHLEVTGGPLTTDGQLHATVRAEAVYDNSTQQFHLQLACGQFQELWRPSTSVIWRTPTNQSLPSSSYENGQFLLSVPNPVVSGQYTCNLDNNSPASQCVPSASAIQRGARVTVDSLEARVTILEVTLKQENDQLRQELTAARQENNFLRFSLNATVLDIIAQHGCCQH